MYVASYRRFEPGRQRLWRPSCAYPWHSCPSSQPWVSQEQYADLQPCVRGNKTDTSGPANRSVNRSEHIGNKTDTSGPLNGAEQISKQIKKVPIDHEISAKATPPLPSIHGLWTWALHRVDVCMFPTTCWRYPRHCPH